MFQKATKTQARLRLAIDGPSGSGKTWTALVAATVLAQGKRIALIDTERGSASLYADHFDFDTCNLDNYHPQKYIDLMHMAEEAGYGVIVIDSLSHAWEGTGGALDLVDQAAARSQSKNSYFAWKDITPLQRELVDAMLQSKCHIIATMRSKTEYVIEEVEKNGRTIQMPRKIGLAPIQRQGMEYEFTIVADMSADHTLVVSKSRCDLVADAVVKKPDQKFFKTILEWLNSGAPAPEPSPVKNELDELGAQLWNGKWETVKPALLKKGKTEAGALKLVEERKASLENLESLLKHVETNWPAAHPYLALAHAQILEAYGMVDTLALIAACSKATFPEGLTPDAGPAILISHYPQPQPA